MNHRVHGILQTRILERVAFPFSKGSSQPRDQTQVSLIIGDSLLFDEVNIKKWQKGEAQRIWVLDDIIHLRNSQAWHLSKLDLQVCKKMHVLCCVILCSVVSDFCNSLNCRLPGSSVHGIFQARILEWVSSQWIFATQGSISRLLCLSHWQVDSLLLSHLRGLCVSFIQALIQSQ